MIEIAGIFFAAIVFMIVVCFGCGLMMSLFFLWMERKDGTILRGRNGKRFRFFKGKITRED